MYQAATTALTARSSLRIAVFLAHSFAIPLLSRPLVFASPIIPRTPAGVSFRGFPDRGWIRPRRCPEAAPMDACVKMSAGDPSPSSENTLVASGVDLHRSDVTRSPKRQNAGLGNREQSPGRQQDAADAASGAATGAAPVGVRRLFFAVELEEEDKAAITTGRDEALRTTGLCKGLESIINWVAPPLVHMYSHHPCRAPCPSCSISCNTAQPCRK